MATITRTVLALGAGVLLSILTTSGGLAQSCTADNDCAINQICELGFFGGSCLGFACRSNAQCFARAPLCRGGTCTRVAPGGPPTSGAGITLSGEGGACGPRRLGGGIIKNIGCRHGLQCVRGSCQRLPQ